jgi:adenylate kinase family enzyme
MNKVCIVGVGGSGKSTLARKLGEVTGLPVYHLDVYFWKAGWVQTEDEEWINIVKDLLKKDKWIMDGNFNSTQDIRFPEADTIIFLDLPRLRCLFNAIARIFKYNKNNSRPDMAEGCHEKFDLEFYNWIWTYNRKYRPQLLKKLEKLKGEKEIIILKSFKEMNAFVSKLIMSFPRKHASYILSFPPSRE